jgi:hypothetical protein
VKTLLAVCAALFAAGAHSHGGGLNAEGCHNNRKTGDYHCHRAKAPESDSAQRTTPQRGQQEQGMGQAQRADLAAPTCYTGPRGGTYTVTPSGRKNYKGC